MDKVLTVLKKHWWVVPAAAVVFVVLRHCLQETIMCLICVQFKQDKLTIKEARQNLGELYLNMDKEHVHEVLKLIWQKEDEELLALCDYGSD